MDKYERQQMEAARLYEPRILAYLNTLPEKAEFADSIVKHFFVNTDTADYHSVARTVSLACSNLLIELKIVLDRDLKLRIRE